VDRGNRIDNRARGNANQLYEKYKTLARDSQTQGDRVMTEYYLQFADHYFRVLSESRSRFEDQRPRRDDQSDRDQSDRDFSDDFADEPEGLAGLASEARRAPPPSAPAIEDDGQADVPQRWSQPETNGHAASDEAEQPRRARRGRPPRREAAEAPVAEERIEIDRLPPALSAATADDEPPKPKRRGRPPKSAQVEA